MQHIERNVEKQVQLVFALALAGGWLPPRATAAESTQPQCDKRPEGDALWFGCGMDDKS
jgi:hypothetical protein